MYYRNLVNNYAVDQIIKLDMPTLFELISPFLIGGISGCTATTFV